MNQELKDALIEGGKQYGLNPLDVATAMSYETGGTFDPWKKGPTTQHGEHRGLIQWGGPQRKQYGITQEMPVRDQVMASFKYLSDRGVKSGDGLLQIYAAINAGNASKIHASDANNGGAPGTVLDKVRDQMSGHQRNAQRLMGGSFQPIRASNDPASADVGMTSVEVPEWRVESPRPPEVETDTSSWWQLQKDAYNTEQTLPWLFDDDKRLAPDPSWAMDQNKLKQDMTDRGIPHDEIERYASRLESVSEADYQDNLGRVKEDWDRQVRLSEAGMSGAVLRIANQVLDPVALAADVAASAVAPQLVLANRARRVSSVLVGAVGGAAGGLASEGVAASVNPNRDQMDMLYGTVFGFGVGGAVGSLMRNSAVVPEAVQLQRAAQNAVQGYEAPTIGNSVGAAKASPQAPFLQEEGLGLLDDRDFAETFGSSIRPDLSARLQSSKNTVVKAGSGLVQDGTGKKDGALNPIAASEDMDRLNNQMVTEEARTYTVQLKEFAKDQKGSRDQIARDFNRQIDAYIRDREPGRAERYPDAVRKAADKQAELYREALKLQKNPFYREGLDDARPVLGADAIADDPHYAPRYWESQRVILAGREYVDGTIERLVKDSIVSAQSGIELDVAGRLSKAFTKAIVSRAHGLEDMTSHALSGDKLDVLIDLLKDEYGLSAVDADYLKGTFRHRKSDAGRDGQNKQRLLLDEKMRLESVVRRDGTVDEAGIGITDLISTDARSNFHRYMRSTMGRVALSRYRFKDPQNGNLLINGFTSDGEFEQYMKLVSQKNADLIKEGKITKEQGELDIKRLRFAYSSILGRPTSAMEATSAGWYLRMARKYNFARIMNQVGFAQISEIGAPIASMGWKAALSQAPALRRVVTDDGETILKSGLADDLEILLGVGTDRLRATADYRMDDLTGIHEEPTGSWRDSTENFLNKANRVTSEASGLTQANIMLERWTAAVIVQKFANMATKGGRGMSKARLADLNLDEAMTARVMTMFNTEGNFEFTKGIVSGRKVVRAHFDKWADREAREAFISAAHRLAGQVIQKNDIGNMAMWMSHPIAKAFMQFRTFMVGAWGKQTLKSLNFRDGVALNHLVLTSGFAGAAYVAQMKIQSIGRSDQEEFLENRLSPGSIAAAAFSRAGPSSIIPMLIDTGRYAARQDPWFSNTRTTGQATDAFFGNPTSGGINDMVQAVRSMAGLFEDREWSQEEVRNLIRPVIFGNSLPVVMGLNPLISDMPERAPR
ncbi:hypothetical protein CN074_25135 [Sinorhizobium medicae]|uniref:hypothetical protein n=1 Tax=Sinorhizobium medicae TaxID=110321 RepID=UPI000FD80977|nr:hypothetical protein [Sinorhizobium medicae]RVP63880.1 hypothetical protein CN074_25135 [Sinorhizobium medicae]